MKVDEPVPGVAARRLRQAVLQHCLTERRRRYPAVLHVGEPGGTELVVAADGDEAGDHGLRVEILEAMLRRLEVVGAPAGRGPTRREDTRGQPVPLLWVTRPGDLDLQDVDAAWISAGGSAAAELGLELPLVLVNRSGWRDPRTGAGREWRRLRPRS